MEKDYSFQRDKKVILKEKGKTKQIDMENISHLTCKGHLTTIHTIENESTTISKLLKYFEIELAEYGFIRVNHNTIINIKNISGFKCGNKRCVILENNLNINISRRKMHKFKSIFMN